jgi:hypothetical protein
VATCTIASHRHDLAGAIPQRCAVNFMTKRKANPRKAGRPPVRPGVYMVLLLRWGVFQRQAKRKNPHRRDPDIANDFLVAELNWFRAHRIAATNYQSFANMHWKIERGRVESRRRRTWGIIAPLYGKRSICTNPAILAAWRDALLSANPELK